MAHQCIIDLQEHTLQAGGQPIPFCKCGTDSQGTMSICYVVFQETTVLLGQTEVELPLSLSTSTNQGTALLESAKALEVWCFSCSFSNPYRCWKKNHGAYAQPFFCSSDYLPEWEGRRTPPNFWNSVQHQARKTVVWPCCGGKSYYIYIHPWWSSMVHNTWAISGVPLWFCCVDWARIPMQTLQNTFH